MQVDPRFAQGRQRAARRRWRKRLRIGLASGVVLAMVGLAGWLISGLWTGSPPPETRIAEGEVLVQSEATTFKALVAAAAPFVDLPGDPMILRFDRSGTARTRHLAGPAALDVTRFGPLRRDRLTLIEDQLIPRETQLMTVLPSSREDFAFFQAQQSSFLDDAAQVEPSAQPAETAAPSEASLTEIWGASLQAGQGAETFTRTAIQNTTTLAFVRAEGDRQKIYDEVVLVIEADRSLTSLLQSHRVTAATAARFVAAASRLMPGSQDLTTGQLVALRLKPGADGPEPLQFSLYGAGGYLGSIARTGPGRYVLAADPWVGSDLFALLAETERPAPAQAQNYRLLDAIYSAAIRNNLPTALVGELIVMMSQVHDLDGFAASQDSLTILYAPPAGGAGDGPGSILFAGIKSPAHDMKCYVIPAPQAGGYECYDPFGGAASLGSAMAAPVRGWPMSSPFGPRRHPILKTVRDHNGVDWAAPIGTPVLAAFDGKVTSTAVSEGYGNLVIIDHGNGLETRYAHLDSIAIKQGASVRAGQNIGAVGTTGLSTGPHLHFELRVGGAPVDPTTFTGGGLAASGAVAALTDRIIRVESAGRADAKNPLSSATGLGQFIDGTWLRLMQTYRPDLSGTMSREDLLALRTNPALAREMVQRLARESEGYLRNRGHAVTPGRLYLAHFLGAEGAATVLSASDDQTVAEVMGPAVVAANPFLKGYTIAALKSWADDKMAGHAGSRARAAPPPPDVRAFVDLVQATLDAAGQP